MNVFVGDLLACNGRCWEAVALDGDAALMARGEVRQWVHLDELSGAPWAPAKVQGCLVCSAGDKHPSVEQAYMRGLAVGGEIRRARRFEDLLPRLCSRHRVALTWHLSDVKRHRDK